MFDIITFGSAAYDIFIKPDKYRVFKNRKFIEGRGICFNLGSKVDVEDVNFSSGGGGTNSAATFARQGFKTAFCGKVGKDVLGGEIIRELGEMGIYTNLITATNKRPTNQSIVINAANKDRTIFVYRGATELLAKSEIPWHKLEAKWFYIAPLSGKLAQLFETIVNFAKKQEIKVAANLGNSQLNLKKELLKKILKKIDILILNQEEASILTKIPYAREDEIFKKIDDMCPGITIMTKGRNGVSVSNGETIYKAKPLDAKIIDKTGAGDAFGSGFVSEYSRTCNIEKAIQLGSANSKACIEKWGSKTGLLKGNQKFERIKVLKEVCQNNGLCVTKKRFKFYLPRLW